MPKRNLYYLFLELWNFLTFKRKIQLILVLLLSILAAISEIISIASIIPFIFILMGNEYSAITHLPIDFNYLTSLFPNKKNVLVLSLSFIFAVMLSGMIKVLLIWTQGKFSALVGVELSKLLLDGHLSKKFEDHQRLNTSEIIAAITQKTTIVVFQVILPALTIIASGIIFFGISGGGKAIRG